MSDRPLKIAITHTRFSYMGGVEKYIYSLVERLLGTGHEVYFIAAKWEKYEHPALHFRRALMLRFPQALRVLSYNYFARHILKRGEFDLVHGFGKTDTQDIYSDGSGCVQDFLAASGEQRKCTLARPHQRVILSIERRRYRRGSALRIIAKADFIRRQILDRYDVDPGRVEVLYNGVEHEHFHPSNREKFGMDFRRRHGLSKATPLLLFVGNDWLRKGLDVVIRALPKILENSEKTLKILVAGHDNHPERFLKMAKSLEVAEHITWLGSVKEIRDVFAAADLFLFPSKFDAFGNAGLEALASGVPAILSSKTGVSEVLDKSCGGWLLKEPENAAELAEAVLYFLNKADLSQCRSKARAIAEKYSWDSHFNRLMEIYREVLDEKRIRG